MGGAYLGDFFHDAIFLNPGHANNWIKIEAVGVATNKKAVGSRIFVYSSRAHPDTAASSCSANISSETNNDEINVEEESCVIALAAATTIPPAEHMRHHVVSTGGSYGSNALEAHIGLGKDDTIHRVVVWWQATGVREEFSVNTGAASAFGIKVNSKIRLVEGSSIGDDNSWLTYVYEESVPIDISKLGQVHTKESGTSCH